MMTLAAFLTVLVRTRPMLLSEIWSDYDEEDRRSTSLRSGAGILSLIPAVCAPLLNGLHDGGLVALGSVHNLPSSSVGGNSGTLKIIQHSES